MRNRKILLAVSATALVAGAVAGAAGIANADTGTRSVEYVDGFGKVTDDFNDHEREVGALCKGCDNSQNTDLVTLWQSILASEGLLPLSEIDGYYGAKTADATADWQEHYGLKPTGEVDQATWAAADDNLTIDDNGYTVTYNGDDGGAVDLERDPDEGEYMMFSVSNADDEVYQVVDDEGLIWLLDSTFAVEPA